MSLDHLIKTTGEWLCGAGAMADVVISSRIRLARNLANYPFLSMATASDRTQIYRQLADVISGAEVGRRDLIVDIHETNELDRHLLVERNLISRQHGLGEGVRGVTIGPDERHALMINEEDHLRVQCLRSGLQLEDAWQEVNRIDDELSERVSFSFDKQFGFLTACPTNVGTGIRVSVMLHLPALKLTKEIEKVARAARDMRLAVRGLQGEGTEAVGDLYQLSNQTTLGKTEEQILEAFTKEIVPNIVEFERAARTALMERHPHRLDDKIWRAYGILQNARCISTTETHTLLSPLRMGIHTGRFDALDLHRLNEIFLFTQPAHLQKITGKPLESESRGVARADFIRAQLAA